MKEKFGFYLDSQDLERFNHIVPKTLRSRFIRRFILNEYLAPVNIDELKEIEDGEVFPFTLDQDSRKRILKIQSQLQNQFHTHVSNSAIMRDVIISILDHYKTPIPEPERKNMSIFVDNNLIFRLDKYLSNNERSAAISEFIINDYQVTFPERAEVKKKSPNMKQRMFNLEIEAIEKLDKFADQLKVTRSDLFRHALSKLITTLENSGIYEEKLQNELTETILKLKGIMPVEDIQSIVNRLLNNEEEKTMTYNENEEKLIVPKTERETDYMVQSKK